LPFFLQTPKTRNFLYLFCHDFRKINGRIKIFEKCTSGVVPHGGRLLPSWGTAAGAWFGRLGGAARRQDPSAERQGLFYFFSFLFLKHF
jgi:hypothetical protein